MHISRLEIDNIKSCIKQDLALERGTTAITGPNGAGKTTIIEAIAWVLFDHLEYKKDEFVRRGEKKGSVRVTIESGLDEREYVIYRDTGSGYYVLDPRLDTRIADKKEEVQRFLWQHLGLEPGTDLRTLFRQAIGVPQGTFTAIFLEGSVERKIAFDRLLKVEEYRQAAEKLRETVLHLKNLTANAREAIARAEGELSRAETVATELKHQAELIETLDKDMADLGKKVDEKRHVVETLNEIETVERSAAAVRNERTKTLDALTSIEKAKAEIAELGPKAEQQSELEKQSSGLREQIAAARAYADQASVLRSRVERLRAAYRENSDAIKAVREKAAIAADVEPLETARVNLVKQIANATATLERDRKFRDEIKGGLCPILSERCLNLQPGQTLDGFISTQFEDETARITAAEAVLRKVDGDLTAARAAERERSKLVELERREAELKDEGIRLSEEQKTVESKIGGLAALEEELKDLTRRATSLGDPRSRLLLLKDQATREPDLRATAAETEKNIERLNADLQILLEKLEIEDHDHTAGYQYDARKHADERSALLDAEKRLAAANATKSSAASRLSQLQAEADRFSDVRLALASELKESERLGLVTEATEFIRTTLKEAAPRVARNYVYHVSLEANQIFREISGNAERTLIWTEDYSIQLEEDGFRRPFQSLSGGEQMSAALAVRLALLKQLTDIRIAFFDEPTTNMDAERRENLASEISRITSFDQLFVISHDETFDHYVDNVIVVGPT
jgi:DNA repair protein SbcC/Rad50